MPNGIVRGTYGLPERTLGLRDEFSYGGVDGGADDGIGHVQFKAEDGGILLEVSLDQGGVMHFSRPHSERDKGEAYLDPTS